MTEDICEGGILSTQKWTRKTEEEGDEFHPASTRCTTHENQGFFFLLRNSSSKTNQILNGDCNGLAFKVQSSNKEKNNTSNLKDVLFVPNVIRSPSF